MNSHWTTIRDRSYQTMLKDEREIRAALEGEYRKALALLERLARQHYGAALEEHRRVDVNGTKYWSIQDWERFFQAVAFSRGWQKAATGPAWNTDGKKSGIGHNGNGHKVEQLEREISRLRTQVTQLKQENLELSQSKDQKLATGNRQRRKSPAKKVRASAQDADTSKKSASPPTGLPTLDGYRLPLVPLKYSDIESRFGGMQWRRATMILYLLSAYGINAHVEIDRHVATLEGVGPRSGSTKRVFRKLITVGLITDESIKIERGEKRGLALWFLRLTDKGRALCEALGWPVIESEWDRLIRLHQGDKLKSHTLAVLYFAFLARARGWQVTVMPDDLAGNTPPDVLIVKGKEQHLVEVELGTRDLTRKWQNLQSAQGYAAICALDLDGRKRLVNDCKLAGIPGKATDLETLRNVPVNETQDDTPLWLDDW